MQAFSAPETAGKSAAVDSDPATIRAQQKAYTELARLARNDEDAESTFGVGIDLASDLNDTVYISRIHADGATADNGILSEGDQICMVDHATVQGLPVSAVQALLLGDENSVVIVSVLKPGEDRITHATLVRHANKDKSEGKYKQIYDVGLSFEVTTAGQVRVSEIASGGPAAKLGFINIGDVLVALDQQQLPLDAQTDLLAFVKARICGPKGTPVVLSLIQDGLGNSFNFLPNCLSWCKLTFLETGIKHHVQLRRTHLFGVTQLKHPKSTAPGSHIAPSEMSLQFGDFSSGVVDDDPGNGSQPPAGLPVGASSMMNQNSRDLTNPMDLPLENPIQIWKQVCESDIGKQLRSVCSLCITFFIDCTKMQTDSTMVTVNIVWVGVRLSGGQS